MTTVFMTGATGYVGSKAAAELVKKGYNVRALTHSDKGAEKLTQQGINAVKGDLEDNALLTTEAKNADAVLHLGMGVTEHYNTFEGISDLDSQNIHAFGDGVKGTTKPVIVTHGTASMMPGQFFTENDHADAGFPSRSPRLSEVAARELLADGINAYVVRLAPSVHGEGDDDHGFIPQLVTESQKQGYVINYNGGENRWTAVNVLDAGHLYVLALEYALNSDDNDKKLHFFNANDEEQLKMLEVVKKISDGLNIPVKEEYADPEKLDFSHQLFAMDIPASSKLTRETLKWTPTHDDLLTDMARYFK